jgi:S1-C subfamily serine protease
VAPLATPRTSRLAIAALICAIAGIPLFGVLTGLVAILLGSLALGALRQTRQKGTGFALTGILLGLADVVVWLVFLSVALSRHGPDLRLEHLRPDLTALRNLDPTIYRAMQANVLIESTGGWFGNRSAAIGSGIILKVAAGQAIILTNRHVVDPDFASDPPARGEGKPDQRALLVHLVDQAVRPGTLIWTAPDGIDLALVRITSPSQEVRAAKWKMHRDLKVGDPVFAIGNPHGLGWTHTQGTISQFRIQDMGGRQLRIIQTQTVINPGNSGGGLYDKEGYLVGVNTWTQDKRVSEGLNFAITLDSLLIVKPPELNLQSGSEEVEKS